MSFTGEGDMGCGGEILLREGGEVLALEQPGLVCPCPWQGGNAGKNFLLKPYLALPSFTPHRSKLRPPCR